MKYFETLKKNHAPYALLKLKDNPFNIAPLFRNFKDIKDCENEEKLFMLTESLKQELEILLSTEDQRILIYGFYGIGKTSLADFFLYLAHNYHNRFCTRIVLTEDNLDRAIHELLLCLSSDILSEISNRQLIHPIIGIRKWIVEKRYHDFLLTSLLKLMGPYTETSETTKLKKDNIKIVPSGIGYQFGYEEEIQVRKAIQAYVEVLPLRKVAEYIKDFQIIVQKLGYKDIVFFIDEADHIPKVENFIKLLTRAREILFSKGCTFLIAGSVELARFTESLGTIFDRLIYLKPSDKTNFCDTLEKRIQAQNPSLKLEDIFTQEALELIFNRTKGIRKEFLRVSENVLTLAISQKKPKITVDECLQLLNKGEKELVLDLKEIQIKILRYLALKELCSPSDKDFIKTLEVTRGYLRNNLENLVERGFIQKEKRGKQSFYSISSQYRSYFAREA